MKVNHSSITSVPHSGCLVFKYSNFYRMHITLNTFLYDVYMFIYGKQKYNRFEKTRCMAVLGLHFKFSY